MLAITAHRILRGPEALQNSASQCGQVLELGAVGTALAHQWEPPLRGGTPPQRITMGPIRNNQTASLGDLHDALAMGRAHPAVDIRLEYLTGGVQRSVPSGPLVVEIDGMEARHLSWQRGPHYS